MSLSWNSQSDGKQILRYKEKDHPSNPSVSLAHQCKVKSHISVSVAVWKYFTQDTFPSVVAVGWFQMIVPRGRLALLSLVVRLLSQLWYPKQETGQVPAAPNGAADGCVWSWSMHRCYSPACNTTLPKHTLCPQTQGSAQTVEVTCLAAISAVPEQLPSIYSFFFFFTAWWQDRQTLPPSSFTEWDWKCSDRYDLDCTAGRRDEIFWLTDF